MIKENIPEYSVTEISRSIKDILDDTFGYVKVRGEISGLKQAASGHVYLNLKDESAVINGIIWKSNVSKIGFQPKDGLEVVCKGKLTTGFSDRYPGRSDYSIHIDSLMPAGEGALMALLEERKKKFAMAGFFEQNNKKEIPQFPNTIGVITSPTGAVLKDILHRIEERYPCNVLLWPTPVQGEDASELISEAIKGFNLLDAKEIQKPDVIIVARGGGSIEDLWPFNEENIIHAVYDSVIPIISAVGHETDTTLIDFVSDLRAPTPTAAAELSTPVRIELLQTVKSFQKKLDQLIKYNFDEKIKNYKLVQQRLPVSLRLFINFLQSSFSNISSKLNIQILREQLKTNSNKIMNSSKRMNHAQSQYLKTISDKVINLNKLVESLSYKSVINRGYAVIRNSENISIKSKKDILEDDKINIELKDGFIVAEIKK